jgi:hypothetical protein
LVHTGNSQNTTIKATALANKSVQLGQPLRQDGLCNRVKLNVTSSGEACFTRRFTCFSFVMACNAFCQNTTFDQDFSSQ